MFFKRKSKTQQPIRFHDFWDIDEQQSSASYRKLCEQIKQLEAFILLKPTFNRWKLTSMIVSVALVVVSGLFWFVLTRSDKGQPTEPLVETVHITDNGTQITLSDGTKVWLSAHSQLRSLQAFTGKTRDVTLEGEAYFEVAHNKKQPFRVLAGGKTIIALGTSFNVRAYSNETDIKVALVEGSISVTDDHSGQAVILKPAQEASTSKNTSTIVVTNNIPDQPADEMHAQETTKVKGIDADKIAVGNVDLEKLMSWKTGKYVFNDIPFEEIAGMLERGFKVTIQIENESLKRKPYTARFVNGESLERILDVIQINAKYSYQYNNGIIVIK